MEPPASTLQAEGERITYEKVVSLFTGDVYKRVAASLRRRGFEPEQYSVWHAMRTAGQTWQTMMLLRKVPPVPMMATITRPARRFQPGFQLGWELQVQPARHVMGMAHHSDPSARFDHADHLPHHLVGLDVVHLSKQLVHALQRHALGLG